jgi:hypothetical protein
VAKELGEYLDDVIAEHGEPRTWREAVEHAQLACLHLGLDRQRMYGPGNIAKFGVQGVCIRATDKIERLATMLFAGGDSPTDETIEDTFGDLVNYATYGILLQRGWWSLSPEPKEPPF